MPAFTPAVQYVSDGSVQTTNAAECGYKFRVSQSCQIRLGVYSLAGNTGTVVVHLYNTSDELLMTANIAVSGAGDFYDDSQTWSADLGESYYALVDIPAMNASDPGNTWLSNDCTISTVPALVVSGQAAYRFACTLVDTPGTDYFPVLVEFYPSEAVHNASAVRSGGHAVAHFDGIDFGDGSYTFINAATISLRVDGVEVSSTPIDTGGVGPVVSSFDFGAIDSSVHTLSICVLDVGGVVGQQTDVVLPSAGAGGDGKLPLDLSLSL